MLDAFHDIRSAHPDNFTPARSLQLDSIPAVAQRTMKNFCIRAFNETYTAAIDQGLIRKQDIAELVGKDVMRVLGSRKSNPSKAECLVILGHISRQKPDHASEGNKRWRHSNARPRDERSPQPL